MGQSPVHGLRIGAVVGVLVVAATAADPATATICAPVSVEQAIAGADVVFVGTVIALEDGDRRALFRVEEQWKGEPLAALTEVNGALGHGAPPDPMVWSDADRTYALGVRYLVVVQREHGRLTDNICTATQPWNEQLRGAQPPQLVGIMPDDADASATERPPIPLLAGLGLVVGLSLIGVLAFRSDRRSRS